MLEIWRGPNVGRVSPEEDRGRPDASHDQQPLGFISIQPTDLPFDLDYVHTQRLAENVDLPSPTTPRQRKVCQRRAFRSMGLLAWEKSAWVTRWYSFPSDKTGLMAQEAELTAAITAALCPTTLAFPECPHASDAYLFLVFSIMHLFTFKRAFFLAHFPLQGHFVSFGPNLTWVVGSGLFIPDTTHILRWLNNVIHKRCFTWMREFLQNISHASKFTVKIISSVLKKSYNTLQEHCHSTEAIDTLLEWNYNQTYRWEYKAWVCYVTLHQRDWETGGQGSSWND